MLHLRYPRYAAGNAFLFLIVQFFFIEIGSNRKKLLCEIKMFLGKGLLKVCKFTGEYACRSMVSIKLPCNLIKTTLRHGCPPINLQHILRALF